MLSSPVRQEGGLFHWRLWESLVKAMRIISLRRWTCKQGGHGLKSDEGVEKQSQQQMSSAHCAWGDGEQ